MLSIARIGLCCTALLLICSCTATKKHLANVDGGETWVHPHSQRRFPAEAAEFERRRIIKMDHQVVNVAVRYLVVARGRAVEASVFLAPEGSDWASFERLDEYVREVDPQAEKVAEDTALLDLPGGTLPYRFAAWSAETLFAGRDRRVAIYWLRFDREGWTILWRIVHAAGGNADAAPRFQRILAAVMEQELSLGRIEPPRRPGATEPVEIIHDDWEDYQLVRPMSSRRSIVGPTSP